MGKGRKIARNNIEESEISQLKHKLNEILEVLGRSDTHGFSSESVDEDENFFTLPRSNTELDSEKKRREHASNRHEDSTFLSAMKFFREFPESIHSSTNIEIFSNCIWKTLSRNFPTLSTSEKIQVVTAQLPKEMSQCITSLELETKEEFLKSLKILHEYGDLDARTQFYQSTPKKGSTLISFLTELLELSSNLDVPKDQRQILVIKRIVNFIPFECKNFVLVNLEAAIKTGQKVVVTQILKPLLEDREQCKEIESQFGKKEFWKEYSCNSKEDVSPSQVETVSQTNPNRESPQFPPNPPCVKCGGKNHPSNNCLLFWQVSNDPCMNCYTYLGINLFHSSTSCRLDTKND